MSSPVHAGRRTSELGSSPVQAGRRPSEIGINSSSRRRVSAASGGSGDMRLASGGRRRNSAVSSEGDGDSEGDGALHQGPAIRLRDLATREGRKACCERFMRPKRNPRRKLAVTFFTAEVVVLLGLFLQLFSLRHSIEALLVTTVGNQITLVERVWAKKTDEFLFSSAMDVQLPYLISFLKGKGANRDMVESLLLSEADKYNMEYMTLVDASAVIQVNAGKHNRTGEGWDPKGVISRVLRKPKYGQLVYTTTVPWSELEYEEGKTYRERISALTEADFTHPHDTGKDSLIRYVVTPVWSNANATGTLLGALVGGDITNGKDPITYLPGKSLGGGYVGLFSYDDSSNSFIRSSSTYRSHSRFVSSSTYTARFDEVASKLQDKLTQAATQRGTVLKFADGGFTYAMKAVPLSKQNSTSIKDTPMAMGVMVRALSVAESGIFRDVGTHVIAAILGLLCINVLILWASWVAFIQPLEKAARYIKQNKKVDLTEVASLRMYAGFTVRILLAVALSSACILLIAREIAAGFRTSLLDSVKAEVGVASSAFDFGTDLMNNGFWSEARNNPYITALLDNPKDWTARNKTKTVFKTGQNRKNIQNQYSYLLDADMKCLWGVNKWRVGDVINPGNVSRLTLSGNAVWKVPSVITYEEFVKDSPPYWTRHHVAGVPDSKLSPYTTKDPVLVRWVGIPMYKSTNEARYQPDGVLLKGDMMNGRTSTMERIVHAVETGFAAIFIRDQDNNFVNLVSVMKPPNSAWKTDVGIPTTVLQESFKANGAVRVRWEHFEGDDWALAAIAVNPSRINDEYGDTPAFQNLDAYLVYGKPRAITEDIMKTQDTWIWVCLVLQLVATALVCGSAYQPLNGMLTALEQRGFLKSVDRPTLLKVSRCYVLNHIPCMPKSWHYHPPKRAKTADDDDSDDDDGNNKTLTQKVKRMGRRLWRCIRRALCPLHKVSVRPSSSMSSSDVETGSGRFTSGMTSTAGGGVATASPRASSPRPHNSVSSPASGSTIKSSVQENPVLLSLAQQQQQQQQQQEPSNSVNSSISSTGGVNASAMASEQSHQHMHPAVAVDGSAATTKDQARGLQQQPQQPQTSSPQLEDDHLLHLERHSSSNRQKLPPLTSTSPPDSPVPFVQHQHEAAGDAGATFPRTSSSSSSSGSSSSSKDQRCPSGTGEADDTMVLPGL